MKFRWKLMIITMLIVSFSFGFGGMLLIQYSYQASIKQEKRAARNSYEMILRMLKEINEMDDTYQNQTFASVLKRLNWQGLLRDSSVRLLKEQHGEVQWKQPLYYNRKNDNFRRSNGFSTKQGKAVVFQNKNKVYYQITSKISYGKETMVFQGAYDISEVYATRHQQLVSFRKIFVLVIGIEIVVSYFLAMILTVENGYQAALMVPTEVLANQHFEAFTKLMEEQEISSCHPVLLTGSTTQKEKRRIYGEIASGEANVVIGTHALIQEKVVYENLGLVITDEQHRFGVKQREALTTRGNAPHVLVMSATPIPRTLAIIVYGDLDISIIDELPAMRLPIKNCVVGTSYRPKAYSFIERQVREGRQADVICPMVEESEGADGENVTDYTARLREIFPSDITIGMLHGKMKPKEKNGIMEQFARGEIQVLVSTTVVEVGVNVPNATVMMVENAERFGLAQLHQLRGRVGRGAYQSYCIFMQGNEEEETSRRLEILNKSNDGFFIAGEDLKLRGPGDLFGIRQSGQLEFRIGDIYQDSDILKAASDAAGGILDLDRELELPQHEKLKERLNAYMKYDLENLGL